MSLRHVCAIILSLGLFLSGKLAWSADDSCGWQTWKCWSQKTRLVDVSSFYQGVPVWSDDDQVLAGIEQRYETRLDLRNWPLQPIWNERSHEYRLIVQSSADLQPQAVNGYRPGIVTELFYMRRLGYFLFKRIGHEAGYYVYDEGRGEEWFVADISPFDHDHQVHVSASPSPDGKLIAVLRCEGSIVVPEDRSSPVFPNLCEVSFLSVAEGLKLVQRVAGIFLPTTPPYQELAPNKGLSQLTRSRWSADGSYLVTDWQQVAYRISPLRESASRIEVPSCQGPASTSSKISQYGDLAIASKDRLAASDAPKALQDSFGCQRMLGNVLKDKDRAN